MEVEMKTRSFIAAVAALTLSTLAATIGDALAAKVVILEGRYTKLKLDGICAANGGNSYGSAGGTYGCSKGNNSVECQNDGRCKGYLGFTAAPRDRAATPDGVLGARRATLGGATSGGVNR
jgi:hypothetical protein